jgi:hypothetical protein
MNKLEIMNAFNTHILELFDAVIEIFPNETEMIAARASIFAIKKANPKLIIMNWKNYIHDKYSNEIIQGNLDFFLDKNYADDIDINNSNQKEKIMEKINLLRIPMKQMSEDNYKKTIKYLQNLTQICTLYFANQ